MEEKNMAAASGNAGTEAADPAIAPAAAPAAESEKKFTQQEMEDIFKERLDKERKKFPDKKQLEAFKAWQESVSRADSQKNADELAAEKVAAAENARAEAEKALAMREAKIAALARDVSPEAADDVIALAMSRVNDDVSVEKAIEEVIAKYPAFTGAEKSAAPITTGVAFGGNSPSVSGVEAAFLAKNPGIKI